MASHFFSSCCSTHVSKDVFISTWKNSNRGKWDSLAYSERSWDSAAQKPSPECVPGCREREEEWVCPWERKKWKETKPTEGFFSPFTPNCSICAPSVLFLSISCEKSHYWTRVSVVLFEAVLFPVSDRHSSEHLKLVKCSSNLHSISTLCFESNT